MTFYAILLIAILVGVIAIMTLTKKQTEVLQRIEHEAKHGPIDQSSRDDAALIALLRHNDTIGALKEYRQQTGCDLPTAQAKIAALKRSL